MSHESGPGNTVEDVTEIGNRRECMSELSEISSHRSQLTLKLGDSADSWQDAQSAER